jgi:Icc protein
LNTLNKNYKIIQISDSHLFANKDDTLWCINTYEQLKKLIQYFKTTKIKPDILLITGDLSNDFSAQSYQNLQEIIAPLKIPTYCLPGNHDSPKKMQESFGKLESAISIPNWRIVLLDSSTLLNRLGLPNGYLAPKQIRFLAKQIKNAPEKNIMIALHHQPILVGSQFIDKLALLNRQKFCNLLYKNSNKNFLVIFGHTHQVFEKKINNVTFLGCPASSAQFTPGAQKLALDPIPPGFRWIELDKNGFKTKIYRCL